MKSIFQMKYLNREFYIVEGTEYADECPNAARINDAQESTTPGEEPRGLTYLKSAAPLLGFYTLANELRYFDGKESRKIAEIGAAKISWLFAKGQKAYFKYAESIFEATPDGVKEVAMLMLDGEEIVVTYNVGEKTSFPPLTPEKTEAEIAAEKAAEEAAEKEKAAKKAAATEAAKRFLRNVTQFTVINVLDSVKRDKYNGRYYVLETIADAIFHGIITPEQVEKAAPECKADLVAYIEAAEGAWYYFELE